jgi:hypothetical protein
MTRRLATTFTTFALLAATSAFAAESDDRFAGLDVVDSSRLSNLHRAPEADLARYRQIVVDDVDVEFASWWVRQVNRSGLQIRGEDIERIRAQVAGIFKDTYTEHLRQRGFEVLEDSDSADPDVLRITPRLVKVDVFPTDVGMNRFSVNRGQSIGEMTLDIDYRDAATGALLASVQDRKLDRYPGAPVTRNDSTFEFRMRQMVDQWARALDAELPL